MGLLDALVYGLRDVFDGAGNPLPRRSRVRFMATVTDDEINDMLIVSGFGGGGGATAAPITNSGTGNLHNVVSQTASVDADVLRFTGAAPYVTGIDAGGGGTRWMLVRALGGSLTIANMNGGSTAANRIFTGTGADVSIGINKTALLKRDSTSGYWTLVSTSERLVPAGSLGHVQMNDGAGGLTNYPAQGSMYASVDAYVVGGSSASLQTDADGPGAGAGVNRLTVTSAGQMSLRIDEMINIGGTRFVSRSNKIEFTTNNNTVAVAYSWTILDEAVTKCVLEGQYIKAGSSLTGTVVRSRKYKRDGGVVTQGALVDLDMDVDAGFVSDGSSTPPQIDWDGAVTARVRVQGVNIGATATYFGLILTRYEVLG